MTQRFDESLIHQLASGAGAPASTNRVSPTDILGEAVTRVIDWVCSGDNRTAQICVNFGSMPTWVNFGSYTPDGGSLTYHSRTNDLDLFAACPPSFSVENTDPGVVHQQAAEFLSGKFAGQQFSVRLFLRDGSHQEPIEEATTESGAFAELPEFPSL